MESREVGGFPPGAYAAQDFGVLCGGYETLFEVENFAARLTQNKAQKAVAGFVLRKGELHFVTVVPGIFARNDRQDGELGIEGLDYGLFGQELLLVRNFLRGAPSAAWKMFANHGARIPFFSFFLKSALIQVDF